MTLDIEYLRTWIGREEVASEHLTVALAQRFNATFFKDADCLEGEDAPQLIHLCVAPPAVPTQELAVDGHPERGGFLPPIPLPSRMWAGGEFRFHNDIKIGDLIERKSSIRDVTVKQGRSGTLCFVTVEHQIISGGRHALTERQDIVYRERSTPNNSGKLEQAKMEPAPKGEYFRSFTPSFPLLFRYSALTFNAHRIHYDVAYAKDEEGYPGLIVHGPMQATLLVHFAAELKGRPPAFFRFRSVAPIFDTSDFSISASWEGENLKLWSAQSDGPVAMEAIASWQV